MDRFRLWVEGHAGLTILIFFGLGLVLPVLPQIPDVVILPMIACVIFCASAKIRRRDMALIRPRQVLGFYLLRFLLLPALLYGIAQSFLPMPIAIGVLLIALVPTGSTAPAFAAIFGGNASLALGLLALSSLLAPIALPLLFPLLTGDALEIDRWRMFFNLAAVILLPVFAYQILIRPRPKLHQPMEHYASFISVLIIAVVLAIVVAKRRGDILTAPDLVLLCIAVQSVLALGFYMFGWFWGKMQSQKPEDARELAITYALGSGMMNIAIGIGLSFAFFSPEVQLFMVMGELPWMLGILLFRRFLDRGQASEDAQRP